MLQQIYPTPNHDYVYELNKDMQFAAAHYIPHEDAGSCQKVHGHTYFANITIGGDKLDESGFLINFQHIKKLIHKRFDHTVLNEDSRFSDQESDQYPTTEVVAKTICEIIQEHLDTLEHRPQCLQVFLRETPTSYVIYRPKKGRVS
ncbi:6-carboxytetrahydropterin synthase QueD [Rossellomorea aquimaris]|uniref:6-carboxytetrahydropterin synthase QueD n=1 Tax=Rossellomorea aquimaris TaxID=189382 RepID=UPI001CD1A36B|nr:6-carboxytetrahydropterin synthase QueD [Rossellomorea aquimaris]MCA1056625.1 6-carboxytetrahydropterin synthase QueD [Rossellomorea aquimaris]